MQNHCRQCTIEEIIAIVQGTKSDGQGSFLSEIGGKLTSMDKIRIYCEDGAMTKEIKAMKASGDIELVSFPFENINRKVIRVNNPSDLTADSTFITADDTSILVSNTEHSDLYAVIGKIIGRGNFNDIRHVDTAYKEKCAIFVSPDKGDIISKSEELHKLTGMKFFHCRDIESIEKYVAGLKNNRPGNLET